MKKKIEKLGSPPVRT